eukprot:6172484-Pleurochrysis_carterae.AAC.1
MTAVSCVVHICHPPRTCSTAVHKLHMLQALLNRVRAPSPRVPEAYATTALATTRRFWRGW